MSEFFSNLWNGIVENYEAFTVALQGLDVAAIISALVVLFKQFTTVKKNSANNKLITDATQGMNNVISDMGVLSKENVALREENTKMAHRLAELEASTDKLMVKLNAVLDVQTLVYQTIKNEDTRTAVNNILMNARYAETATREALVKKVEQLQAEVQTLTNDAVHKIAEVAEEAKALVTAPSDTLNVKRS